MPNSLVYKLYQTLLNGAAAPAGTFVVLESPTRPIDTAKLADLDRADGAGAAAVPLELFSRLVDDDMPLLSSEWRSSGIRLAEAYEQMLQATPNGPVQDRKFAEARLKFETLTLGSVIQPGVKFQPTWPNPVGWAGPDQPWSKLRIEGTDMPEYPGDGPGNEPGAGSDVHSSQLGHWPDIAKSRGVPIGAEPAIPDPARPWPRIPRQRDLEPWELGGDPDPAALSEALFATGFEASYFGGPVSPTETPIYDPDNPRSGPTGPNDAPRLPWPPKKPQPRPLPDDPPIALPKVPRPPSPPPAPPPPSKLLEVEYLTVSLSRPWLSGLLLRFPGWSLPGFPAGYFSDGADHDNKGITPLLPTGFIAIRNLTIRGDWSDEEAQDIYARLNDHMSSTFGPFTLSAFGTPLGSFDGATLTIPGTSILAWYCNVLPVLPPASPG